MFSKIFQISSILWAMSPLACAASSGEQAVDWENGAKRGRIVSFYTADSADVDLPECLAHIPKADLATMRFVKIEYRHVRHMRSAVAQLPDALQAKVNDQVEVWPEDCSRGKLSRIERILPPVSQ